MRLAHLLNTLIVHQVALWATVLNLGIPATIRWLRATMSGHWLDLHHVAVQRTRPPSCD
jgi:hypothetical protein